MKVTIDLDDLEPHECFHLAVIAFGSIDLRSSEVHAVHDPKYTTEKMFFPAIIRVGNNPSLWPLFRGILKYAKVDRSTMEFATHAIVTFGRDEALRDPVRLAQLHEFLGWLVSRGFTEHITSDWSPSPALSLLLLHYDLDVHMWITRRLVHESVDVQNTILRACCDSPGKHLWKILAGNYPHLPTDLWRKIDGHVITRNSSGLPCDTPYVAWHHRNTNIVGMAPRNRQYIFAMMIAASGTPADRLLQPKDAVVTQAQKNAKVFWQITSELPVDLLYLVAQMCFNSSRNRQAPVKFTAPNTFGVIFGHALKWWEI